MRSRTLILTTAPAINYTYCYGFVLFFKAIMEFVIKLLNETKYKLDYAAQEFVKSGGNLDSTVYKKNRDYVNQIENAIKILNNAKGREN